MVNLGIFGVKHYKSFEYECQHKLVDEQFYAGHRQRMLHKKVVRLKTGIKLAFEREVSSCGEFPGSTSTSKFVFVSPK